MSLKDHFCKYSIFWVHVSKRILNQLTDVSVSINTPPINELFEIQLQQTPIFYRFVNLQLKIYYGHLIKYSNEVETIMKSSIGNLDQPTSNKWHFTEKNFLLVFFANALNYPPNTHTHTNHYHVDFCVKRWKASLFFLLSMFWKHAAENVCSREMRVGASDSIQYHVDVISKFENVRNQRKCLIQLQRFPF